MRALWLHLIVVHVAVGVAAIGLGSGLWAWRTRDRRLWTAYCLISAVLAGLATLAYESGPPARNFLELQGIIGPELTVDHARLALYFYLGALAMGLISLQTLLSGALTEGPAVWRRILFLSVAVFVVVAGWITAHRGGEIRRPELRAIDHSESSRDSGVVAE